MKYIKETDVINAIKSKVSGISNEVALTLESEIRAIGGLDIVTCEDCHFIEPTKDGKLVCCNPRNGYLKAKGSHDFCCWGKANENNEAK